ncbi:hypothetical protein K2Y11_10200 [bacterium]|jgi:hypothetical protein|nr:hypothetical protein [bacterium]
MNSEIDWIRELSRQADLADAPSINVSSRVLEALRHQPKPRIDRPLAWIMIAASILMMATVGASLFPGNSREEDVTYLALTDPSGIDEFEMLEQVMQ